MVPPLPKPAEITPQRLLGDLNVIGSKPIKLWGKVSKVTEVLVKVTYLGLERIQEESSVICATSILWNPSFSN